ncbi:vomeronasal 1 receptor 19 [Mus musculus]|uniref:Vomeronasal type-1 receptor n=2 Tax=Mus musculus TaxID=10090 RepID=Q8R2C7_MOUSE|nr:vomeronasal 1 receptor 19 [Mus musculus]AEF00029.1 vomeronasal type 1 receptor C27 [Mus musculus domesticus]AAI25352.1 Vomeronasal 1 receptor, C27 [Mus musculus]AAI32236.1 Vomeronasal 1 receptor, C27 [Mus musculus]AAL47888.1 vomeronasal receptor V1RC27 [Mus musculus]AEF00030.1 vomeronasal type 1 receptor C27 [Mus musculus domesticus]|eukprot:NP_598943.1 vomeronasal 1 receptor 19 [Mus musculus]
MSSFENVLYIQAGLGLLPNMFLLFFYTFIILGHRSKPMDLISCQLTFIHIMMILSEGDNLLANILESLKFGNGIKCKTTFYINRVMRGLSICITCLLSVSQAITISPSTSLLAKFKSKVKKHIIYAFFYLWSFNLSFSSRWIFYVAGFTNVSENRQMKVTKSCSLFPMNYIIRGLFLTVTMSRDICLVGVMLITSTYMVIILCRHQRQCKHLHSISYLRASPEKRATQNILLLVVFFVVMYWVDFIISFTSTLFWMYDPVILTVQQFVMYAYPTIAPLVQISSDKRIIHILIHILKKFTPSASRFSKK